MCCGHLELVCEAAIIKDHRMGGLRGRNVLSHSFGGQKSRIKVLVPGRAVREGSDPGLAFTYEGLLVTFGVPWLYRNIPDPCLHVHMGFTQ